MTSKTATGKVRPEIREMFKNDPDFRKQAEADYGAKAKELGISVMELFQIRADRWTDGGPPTAVGSASKQKAKKQPKK